MPKEVEVKCQCGAFQAVIHDVSLANSSHSICYCRDCQAFARHMGQAKRVMDKQGGTDVLQVQPYQVEITHGLDQLRLLQLDKKGLYRWHTACCATPICNTMGTPKFSFVGFMAANLGSGWETEVPVQFRYKREHAFGEVDAPSGSLLKFTVRMMRNVLGALISGRWKQTPFFDIETGRSIVKPVLLSDEERIAAYKIAELVTRRT